MGAFLEDLLPVGSLQFQFRKDSMPWEGSHVVQGETVTVKEQQRQSITTALITCYSVQLEEKGVEEVGKAEGKDVSFSLF